MTTPRLSFREPLRQVGPLLAVLYATACGGQDPTTHNGTSLEEDSPTQVTALTRPLEPTIAVADDATVGTSYDAVVEQVAKDAVVLPGSYGSSCIINHYERHGLVVAVDERCDGSYRRLMVFGDGDSGPQSLLMVYGDFDDDDAIDGWFDPAIGTAIEDTDFDGHADRARTTADHISPEVVDSFCEGWSEPAVLDEHVLEDMDYDGHYDRETLTAGQTAEGEPTYFVEEE